MKAAQLIAEIAVMLGNEGNVRVQIDVPGAIYDIDAVTFAPDEELPTIYIGTR
ncbi:hypothetical protein [Actinosynnema sp. ALI-1.44]|uniref:hypothetical protein n=1 Tax=Actinosynnema sp. ALI-1.44 TaxID=1933779 RepID=UPI00143D0AB0|nr:hypothetical protein [Actinosynnema sp. ALI-1.44]